MSIFGIKKQKRNIDLGNLQGPLDMDGNQIINLGNPDNPNDAVSKRYVYRKIQNVIKDYDIEDIKNIKQTLETEKDNFEQLTKDIKANEKIIIELQGKIEKEMEIISKAMKDLTEESGETDDQIKEVIRVNFNLIGNQIKELKDNMIKHEELKEKINEAEKKLQNMYQLEIKTEIRKLNDDTDKRNLDLLNNFISKFAEFKDELRRQIHEAKGDLEKTASERGDEHDSVLEQTITSFNKKLEDLKDLLSTINNNHTKSYNDLQKDLQNLQNNITSINEKIKEIENKLDFEIEKSVKQEESINTINNRLDAFDNQDIVFEKRIDDLSKWVIDLIEKVHKHKEDIYNIPLFKLTFNRNPSFKLLTASRGIPLLYEIGEFDNELKVKTADIFSTSDLKSSTIIDYESFIEKNHKFNLKTIGDVHGFKIKKSGWYFIDVRINISHVSSFDNFYFHSDDEIKPFSKNDNKTAFSLNMKKEFTKNSQFVIYPIINESDSYFTIKPDSYFKLTYYWENNTLF